MRSNQTKVSYLTVQAEYSGQRLDNFLLRELKGAPRSLIYRIVRRGEVRVNDGRVRAHARLQAGDQIRIPPIRLSAKPCTVAGPKLFHAQLEVLYEDDHILVINKPAGIAVHAGSGISMGLIEHLRATRSEDRYLDLVHRLDRATSGCLLLAKKRSALRILHQDFRQTAERERRVQKKYQALVYGSWNVRRHAVDMPLKKNAERSGERIVLPADDGQSAKSKFTTLQAFLGCTLMEIDLITGRTHQARVHAAYRGHPIIGDEKYGDKEVNRRYRSMGLKRLFLHAGNLVFTHPASGEKIDLSCPLPDELTRILRRIGCAERN